jgi:hypothetical protein
MTSEDEARAHLRHRIAYIIRGYNLTPGVAYAGYYPRKQDWAAADKVLEEFDKLAVKAEAWDEGVEFGAGLREDGEWFEPGEDRDWMLSRNPYRQGVE